MEGTTMPSRSGAGPINFRPLRCWSMVRHPGKGAFSPSNIYVQLLAKTQEPATLDQEICVVTW